MCVNKPQFIKLPIALIFVTLLGIFSACDAAVPEAVEDEDLGYTTVEYSEDGKEIRLYLDGVGVPVTRAQRAITKDLAMMAYDCIEVIFINGTVINRASWDLGYPAVVGGIRGATPVDYSAIYSDGATGSSACMFVGKKDGKVLLGVGRLTSVRNNPPTGATTSVGPNSTSVTFSIAAIQSGLNVGTYPAVRDGVVTDSFRHGRVDGSGTDVRTAANSFLVNMGGVDYPVYIVTPPTIPETGVVPPVVTIYSFRFLSGGTDVTSTYKDGIRHINNTANTPSGQVPTGTYPMIQKRVPRFPYGSGYMEPKNLMDTGTIFDFTNTFGNQQNIATVGTSRNGYSFASDVEIRFTPVSKRGIFAFNLQIPVYMVNRDPSDNGGPAAELWYIRSGVGSEFFSLDDGKSRGGCVLMSVDVNLARWNIIEWTMFR
jgi:hypothetical protein